MQHREMRMSSQGGYSSVHRPLAPVAIACLLMVGCTGKSDHQVPPTISTNVTTQPDGAFIGRLEFDVRHDDHQQERTAALLDENSALRAEVLALRNRVRELEAALNGFD